MTIYEELAAKALWVAQSNIGFGEEGANNRGKFITAIGAPPGEEWCAYFQSYCWKQAAILLGISLPFQVSGGAKSLSKSIAKFGRSFKDPELAMPGDLVCWHRGKVAWKGHIAMVESIDPDGVIHTIEGNVGTYPSRVKRLSHDVSKERLFQFSSIFDEEDVKQMNEAKKPVLVDTDAVPNKELVINVPNLILIDPFLAFIQSIFKKKE